MKYSLKTIAIALMSFAFIIGLLKRCTRSTNNITTDKSFKSYTIEDNNAFFTLRYPRASMHYSEPGVKATELLLKAAKIVHEIARDNDDILNIKLEIVTTCEDNYGHEKTHSDFINFPRPMVIEFRKYSDGESLAYNYDKFRYMISDGWDCCTLVNPSVHL